MLILWKSSSEIDTQEYPYEEHRGEIQSYQMIITCLISSLVLLNTKGELTYNSLLPLSDMFYLQNFIDLEQGLENRDDFNFNVREELTLLFPKLLFVIRDFKDVIKKNGKNVSCQQYLSGFLEDDDAFMRGSKEEQKIRRRIIKYFKTRDACSLVITEAVRRVKRERTSYNPNFFFAFRSPTP